jgi:hypothetical protein
MCRTTYLGVPEMSYEHPALTPAIFGFLWPLRNISY